MRIKSIVVDDEKHGRENLAGILEKYCPEVSIVSMAESVENAIDIIQKEKPDLVFLDIEMPGANGFQLLEHFPKVDFEVIFVTAYDNYAIKAIRFSAADYILKPINYKNLCAAVEKVSHRIYQKAENKRIRELFRNIQHPQDPRIGLPTGDRIEFVEVENIIRCKGEGNYSYIYFKNGEKMLVSKTLVEFEELLSEHSFLRTHKTHLVNLKHVSSYIKSDGGSLLMSDGKSVAVSRRRRELVQQTLKLNLK